ncbi:MAG TPA: cupin domain-containing protein [Solirubrobacteraceae bacterium]|nr:cupin domain-containing protein [Solirubrobacteraceae bacterium]
MLSTTGPRRGGPPSPASREPERLAEPQIVSDSERLWFLGTLARMKLDGRQTGGRFSLWEGVLPHGAAPPLHSHPQDETFYVLDGELTAWLVDLEGAQDHLSPPAWVTTHAQRCRAGAVVFAPAGTPHSFRVESDTARMLFLSTPSGIEEYVRALGEPAQWPWLQPPPEEPRVAAERIAAVERELGVVRHGPPPPAAIDPAA